MEDRFQQFETALQQAIGTLQRSDARATASDARVASLEGFAAAAARGNFSSIIELLVYDPLAL